MEYIGEYACFPLHRSLSHHPSSCPTHGLSTLLSFISVSIVIYVILLIVVGFGGLLAHKSFSSILYVSWAILLSVGNSLTPESGKVSSSCPSLACCVVEGLQQDHADDDGDDGFLHTYRYEEGTLLAFYPQEYPAYRQRTTVGIPFIPWQRAAKYMSMYCTLFVYYVNRSLNHPKSAPKEEEVWYWISIQADSSRHSPFISLHAGVSNY